MRSMVACRGREPSSTDPVLNMRKDDGMLSKTKKPTARAKATVLSVMKEMDEPRLAESVRNKMIGGEESRTVIPVEKPALNHVKQQ